MFTLFSRFSHRYDAMGLILILALVGAWLLWHPGRVSATEVPFGAEYAVSNTFDGAQSVAAADLDRDGDLDLVSAALNADDIVWWENTTGDGALWSAPNVITATLPGAVDAVPADLDGDGDLDILGASSTTGDVLWWENANGDGSVWNAAAVDSFFDETTDLDVTDVDGDGDLDGMAVGTVATSESVFWFENAAGDGSAWTRRGVAVGLVTPAAIVSADLDRDGDFDLIVSSLSAAEITWWRNNDGTGLSWTSFPISSSYFGANGLEIADLDGDGDPDILGAFASDDTVSWQENDGTGQGWTDHPIVETLSDAVSVAATDLDGDGDLDVLGAGNTANQTLWWENSESDGTAWVEYTISFFFDGARAIRPADINGDGITDVVGAAENAGDVVWWHNATIHGSAIYSNEGVGLVDGNFDGVFSVAAADLDRDGDQDLLAGAYNTGEIAWYQNTAVGTSWTKGNIGNLTGVRSVFIADLNGDGTLDALAAGEVANDIAWWANDGNGSFGSANFVDTNFSDAYWVAGGDVDGDGDQDVLGAGFAGAAISWWENQDGNGTFSARNDIATGYAGADSVSAADMDRDGDLDVLASAENADDISWWANNGDGTAWTLHPIDTAIDGPASTFAADVDSDGDLDVLGASNVAQAFGWWENLDGQGTFTSTQTVIGTGFDNAESVFGADLDLDGDLDVAGAAQYENTLVWFENEDGMGFGWEEHIVSASLQEAVAVFVADVDGDGAPDLLSAAAVDDDLLWWENRGGQFSLPTEDTSPGAIPEGGTTDVFAITATHLGRTEDSEMELATLEFLFEESPGNSLSSPEANAIIETLYLYLDEGSGVFDDEDTLVFTLATLTLDAGFETLQLPEDETNVQLTPGETKTFFLVLQLTPDAGSQKPNQAILTHLTEPPGLISSAEDADNDIPLRMAYAPNISTILYTFSPDLFVEKYANELPGGSGLSAPMPAGGPAIVQPGDLITYTIFFSNTGGTSATNVMIADLMPPEALYESYTNTGIPVTLTVQGGVYVWDAGTLPSQTAGSITILATLASFMTEEYTFNNTVILTGTIVSAQFSASSAAGLEINLPPSVDAGDDQTVSLAQTFTFTANFTDPGLDDTHQAMIDWGDGQVTEGVVDPVTHTVTGSHTYLSQGTFQVTVTVMDNDGGEALDFALYTVDQAVIYLPLVVRP